MAETFLTDYPGSQTDNASGFKTLLANVDAWKTEIDLSMPILKGRTLVVIQNLGVAAGGAHTDAAHTLDFKVYNPQKAVWADPTAEGLFTSILKFGSAAVLLNGDERLGFRSNIEDGVCNLLQFEV